MAGRSGDSKSYAAAGPLSHDLLLDRITFEPQAAAFNEPPWPAGLAPQPVATALQPDGSLPPADVVIFTWTAAEKQALATVLTPGVAPGSWIAYRNHWTEYAGQLTSRSPARSARRLGEFYLATIGGLRVCCFHSQLHPATDAATLPTAQLAAQAAAETGAKLMITTGTAGGAGAGTVLGDVNVATAAASLFTTRLAGHPWSKQTWPTAPLTAGQSAMLGMNVLAPLLAANSGRLPAQWAPRPPQVWFGDTVSTDFFAFEDVTDHFGLAAYKPGIRDVEMDDAAVAYGLSTMADPPPLAVARNASDPIMPGASENDARQAESIYEQYGQYTTWNSAIACWALVAGLAGN
jgi:nucleoside phosphorylase